MYFQQPSQILNRPCCQLVLSLSPRSGQDRKPIQSFLVAFIRYESKGWSKTVDQDARLNGSIGQGRILKEVNSFRRQIPPVLSLDRELYIKEDRIGEWPAPASLPPKLFLDLLGKKDSCSNYLGKVFGNLVWSSAILTEKDFHLIFL
jgi:hypothetical protein